MTQAFTESNENPTLSQSHSLQLCALNNPNQKKRLFVRKPGPNYLQIPAEKHRKNQSEHVDTGQTCRQTYLQNQNQQNRPKEAVKTMKTQRQTQNFRKQSIHQTSFNSIKERALSPRKSTLDLLLGLKYIQRPTEQINGQNSTFKSKYPVICISDLETQQTMNLDDTSDNSLKSESRNDQSLKTVPKIEDEFYSSSSQQLKNLLKGESYSKFQTAECFQCKNLKKMNHFLTLKCDKLQKQLQLKSEDIRLLNEKLNSLKGQKQTLKCEQGQLREEMYMREMQIYQECSARYENIRKQLSRVAQRVKYLEIENRVLSRYKQDCFQAKRDYQKIKQQNENLKKQINSICRMGQKYNSKKPSVEVVKKQYGKSPYFKLNKQQDTISLELSQASYEHI